MDNSFLSYLLALCLALLLVLYLYQNKIIGNNNNNNKNNNKNNKSNTDAFFPVILDTCSNNNRTTGMPVHHVGPVINFHQSFGKYKNMQNGTYKNGFPNGIPEMAWRNYYLSNFSRNEVPEQDPFVGTVIRNYLDNMDNVKNIYREC